MTTKPLLQLPVLPLMSRIKHALWASFMIAFFSLFVWMPVYHLCRKISEGQIPWQLVVFACIAIPFGLFFIWLATTYRVWILPYRFTVDFSEMTCGYRWKNSGLHQRSLAGLKALVATCNYSCRSQSMTWYIAAKLDDEKEAKSILNGHTLFGQEDEAFDDCMEICLKMADYLEVPIEYEDWSEELIQDIRG